MTCSCFTTGKDARKLITCVIVVWKNVSPIDFLHVHILHVSFGHCRPLAASQVTCRKDTEVLHKFTTLDHTHAHLLMSCWPPKNMQFCRFHQTVSPFDRSLLGCCGQFRRSLWRVLLHIDWYWLVRAPVRLTNSTILTRRQCPNSMVGAPKLG